MSNISLKEQLQAVVSQLGETVTEKNHVEKNNPTNQTQKPFKAFNNSSRRIPEKKLNVAKVKPKWVDYMQYGVELLKVYFPLCFKEANQIQPLKKGIKLDLVKQLSCIQEIVTDDKACMVKSLAYYVNTLAYHRSVIEGAIRIDLNGQQDGAVLAEEAKYSAERYQAKMLIKRRQPLAKQTFSAAVASPLPSSTN